MLHILRTPTKKEKFGKVEKRYCFGCRKHTKHQKYIHIPYGETGQYYDPHTAIECEVCGKDKTRFGSY